MSRVCACSQEKECPVEKTLSNNPVKSEREVLLVGEFCLLSGDSGDLKGEDLLQGDLALLLPTSGSFGYPKGGGSPGTEEYLELCWGQGVTL